MAKICRLAAIAAIGLMALSVSTVSARAGLIDVQFSGQFSYNCPGGGNSCTNPAQTGAGVVGAAGDQWNDFRAGSGSGALLNALGAASGVSITFTSDAPYSSYTDGTNANAFASTSYANLMAGYLATSDTNGNGIVITLSGLAAGQAYNLYVYSEADGAATGRSVSITANGVTAIDTQTGAGTLLAGSNYVELSGTANASGQVAIHVATLSGESDINGLQLQTVPEPGSLALLGAGVAALAFSRRRKGAPFGR